MTDLNSLSDADILAALGKPAAGGAASSPYGAMSDADLLKAIGRGETSVTKDVIRSAGAGLAKGAMGLAGLPGDVADMAGNGAEWLMQRAASATGLAPREPQSYSEISAANRELSKGTNILPRSEDLRARAGAIGGPLPEPQTIPGKYAQTIGEFMPGAVAMPGSMAANAARLGVLPGAASETAGQALSGTPYEFAGRLGAAILAPSTGRAITPFPITQERQALINTLKGEGVDLTAGQATGSRPLRWAESVTADLPGGGKAAAIDQMQRDQFTAAALRRMGVSADKATPDILAFGKGKISNQFETLANRNTATFDPQFGADLGGVLTKYESMVPPSQQAPIVQKMILDIAGLGGSMPGAQYQAWRSRLDKSARSVKNSDPPLSEALFGVRNALDDAMGRSISPADKAAWEEARGQWKNWKVIEKAATGAGERAAEGSISPAALRNATVVQNRGAYATGNGDFADLARAGTALMSPLPNSGTGPRSYFNHLMAAGGAAGGAAAGGPIGALAGATSPIAASRILMSAPVQSWLANQVLGRPASAPTSTLEKLLLMNGARQDAMAAP